MSERKKEIECPDCGILPGSYKCMPLIEWEVSFQVSNLEWTGLERKMSSQFCTAYLELEQSLGIRKLYWIRSAESVPGFGTKIHSVSGFETNSWLDLQI